MSRKVLATVVAFAATAALAACGGGGEGTQASGDAPAGLLSNGKLSVCTDPEYPPMEYFQGGDTSNPVGFDPDAARALADKWGLEISWQNTAFDGLMPALQAKRCGHTLGGTVFEPGTPSGGGRYTIHEHRPGADRAIRHHRHHNLR